MKQTLYLLTVLLTLFLSSCTSGEKTIDWNDDDLHWHSYEDGLNQMKASGNNDLLIIYTDWCPTCKKYSNLFKKDSVIEALNGVTLIRSNRDKEPHISDQYDIDGDYIPRTFALDNNGEIIQDLDSKNPKWWYFLPATDPEYLVSFVNLLKQY